MKKLILLFVALTLSTGLWAQGSVITYTATEKLNGILNDKFGGIRIHSHDYDQETQTGTITFQDVVTTIGEKAFRLCTTLTSITIPASVTTIGDEAFYCCRSLTSITIPSMVTKIGDNAFFQCSSLESATIKAGVIGEKAFWDCTNLSFIDLQEGVTRIGDYAFQYCAGMASLTTPSTMTNIGARAFDGWKNLTSVTIKKGDIGGYAFDDCTNLKSITLGNAVTSIGNYAFSDCSVTSVTFLGSLILNNWSLEGIGTAESPADLKIPSTWLANDKPINSTTPWHGGYFNCTYEKTITELLGELAEPCDDCPAIKVKKGDKEVILYAPDKVEFIKTTSNNQD